MSFLRKLWKGWKAIAHRIGKVQTFLLMTLFYILILGPIAVVLRVLGKRPLQYRNKDTQTYWHSKPDQSRGEAQYFQSY